MTTETKATHTPGPWKTGGVMTRVEVLPDGWNMPMCVADCHTKSAPNSEAERVANAAFIVRACNSHDALVAALCRAVDASNAHNAGGHIDYDWIGEAERALALATK